MLKVVRFGLVCLLFALAATAGAAQTPAGKSLPLPGLPEKGGCRQHLAAVHGAGAQQAASSVEAEIIAFRTLAERSLGLRAATIKAGQELREKAGRGIPLSSRDLAVLSEGIGEHLSLRRELLAVAEAHECWLDLSEAELASAGIIPEVRLQGIMLSLSAALVLYDNYLLAVSLFEGDPKLRRLLNERDPGYAINRAELAKVTLSYNSITNRSRVRRAVSFYEKAMAERPGRFSSGSGSDYLATLIAQSPSCEMVREWSPLYVVGRKLGFMGAVTYDSIADLEREGVNVFSMLFGNTVGLVETRKGKLYRRDDVHSELQGRLRSGDILLEKTPFRLTDKLIPGYWGHAAIWVGTEEELREMGIWDHPVVAPHRGAIRSGRLVVEALRSGVEMNTLEHFLNVDSFGALRRPGLSREERARIVLQTLRQVGKPYDFNFDVESKERIYCSKLVYFAYQGVSWPTKKSLGRTTFSPDDVAAPVVDGGALELVSFYHDGERIAENPLTAMAALMGAGPAARPGVQSGGTPLR